MNLFHVQCCSTCSKLQVMYNKTTPVGRDGLFHLKHTIRVIVLNSLSKENWLMCKTEPSEL